MPKKVLICEDHKEIAEGISSILKNRGYEPIIALVKEEGCTESCIEGHVENAVIKENPDYFIVDGLNNRYDCVIEAAKRAKHNVIPIVFSGNENIIRAARNKGYAAFLKPEIEEIFKFIQDK